MSNLYQLFRTYRKKVVFGLVIFLVASLSYGVGYLAGRDMNRAPIVIEKCSNLTSN
ncbi:MAG: hypothetical protein G01um101420_953 [Parcubacteria group bacterium Gr01-1014_20]|nr:MAG: hypothetical protein G01um101420_953 [Parcubacteria group bacterium Gr01-1014_20]